MPLLRSAPIAAALAAAVFLMAPAAPARKTVILQGGAQLTGDILKETPDNTFLDLGFEVLTIPNKAIERVEDLTAPRNEATSETAASETGPLELGERREFGSLTQMIDAAKPSVAIVSNPAGFGAGFIIDKRGRVLTNHHVVRDQQYHAVTLLFKGGDGATQRKKIENVELIAFSRLLDIALLQMPEKDIKDLNIEPLPLGVYENLKVGDSVYAIGNPGLGRQMLDNTVSQGIISSVNRNINDILYLQTTAAVNPGNSGGPLLNTSGEVVGLVTLKAIFQENIAFALPVNYIRLFLLNEKAFAFDKSNPNYSYRYVAPE